VHHLLNGEIKVKGSLQRIIIIPMSVYCMQCDINVTKIQALDNTCHKLRVHTSLIPRPSAIQVTKNCRCRRPGNEARCTHKGL